MGDTLDLTMGGRLGTTRPGRSPLPKGLLGRLFLLFTLGSSLVFLSQGRAAALPPYRGDRTAHYILDKDPSVPGRWTMNGKSWPNVPPLLVKRGDRVEITFENRSDMEHPMHLHGHRFALVSTNGIPLARPLVKDTALVAPWTGRMTWRFTADAFPGTWLLHCHNAVHMMGGMMTEVRYVG